MKPLEKKSTAGQDTGQITLALNRQSAILDAAVVRRDDLQGEPCHIAYIVPDDISSIMALSDTVRQICAEQQWIDGYTFVSALPIGSDGLPDSTILSRFEVIDDDLTRRWERVLSRSENIDQVAVIPVPSVPSHSYSHRKDLLSGFVYPVVKEMDQGSDNGHSLSGSGQQQNHRQAIVHGEKLHLTEDHPETLGQALERAARLYPEHGVSYVHSDGSESFHSYSQLLDEAQDCLTELLNTGVVAGDKVIFQLPDNREFLVAFWACILGGMVPVPLSVAPGYTTASAIFQKLINVWNMLGKPVVITTRQLLPEIRTGFVRMGISDARIETAVHAGHKKTSAYAPVKQPTVSPDDLTLLLLTSGSTGLPKAVMHSHRTLLNRSASSKVFNQFNSDDISLNWMPLDHVGGIVMFHLRDVYSGCNQVQVSTEWVLGDPLHWIDLINRYKATISWAPNFAYALVNDALEQRGSRKWDLSHVRHMLNGGEAVVAKTARKFLKLLSSYGLYSGAIKPAWGMSETSSGITDSHYFSLETIEDNNRVVEVGSPIPNISLRIVDEHNQIIAEGEKGRLQVRGPSIMLGYYSNPEANSKTFTEDGWLDTGDIGLLNNGSLTVTARTKDEIIINGINYLASEIEAVAESVDGVEVAHSAACAVRTPESNTDELAIFICPTTDDEQLLCEIIYSVRRQVAGSVGIRPAYVIPVEKNQIPKTNIGKIQHSILKSGFDKGEFDEQLKYADILTETNTIPDWFYRKVWHRKEAEPEIDLAQQGLTLIFVDKNGLGRGVSEALKGPGQTCVLVEKALEFNKPGPNEYCINPVESEHYHRLISDIYESGQEIDQILHCWTYDDSEAQVSSIDELRQAQYSGLFSLLYLVQALVKIRRDNETDIRLQVFSSNTQVTSAGDTGNYVHSTVTGMLKTIPLETPWLNCRHIDMEGRNVALDVQNVLYELQAVNSDDEVAYRNDHRLVWQLSRVDMCNTGTESVPLKQGGIYLITGGLGGIGSSLARYLAKNYQAKLILTGTTVLPEREQWSNLIEQPGKMSQRLQVYMELESMEVDFIYTPVDVSDYNALEEAVSAAESHWNDRLAGVFHLASAGDPSLHWEDMDRYRVSVQSVDIYDSMFRSKVYGAWAVDQLLKKHPDAINVAFSSVISLFGGATFSAYAAAQSFLNCISNSDRHNGNNNSYCFIWSVWQEIGMSKGDPEFIRDAYQNAGYSIIPEEQGFDSLISSLYRGQKNLVIGLDSRKQNVARYLAQEWRPLEKLAAFYTGTDNSESDINIENDLTLQDRFGVYGQCEFIHLDEMSLTSDGAIDYNYIYKSYLSNKAGNDEIVLPRNELEQRVAGVWHDVLAIDMSKIDVNESFFQLGGNSLSATQILSRLNRIFGKRMSMRDLFEHSTIAGLAAYIEDSGSDSKVDTHEDDTIAPNFEELLAKVDDMSEEQVEQLLRGMQEQ